MPLLKSVIKPLDLLRLTVASSAIDNSIARKIHGSETILVISNEEMINIMKIIQVLEDSGKTIKNETKEQNGGFLSMLMDTLGASLLGDLLTNNLLGKGNVRAREGFLRAGEGIKKKL